MEENKKRGFLQKLDTKSIMSLTATGVFATLAIRGTLDTKDVMVLLTLVFQSFFSYQNNKKGGEQSETTIR